MTTLAIASAALLVFGVGVFIAGWEYLRRHPIEAAS